VEGRGGRRGGRGTVRWPESCVQARPPKASPKKSQEEERRFYKELIGRCTTPLPRFAKPLVAAYRRYFRPIASGLSEYYPQTWTHLL